PDQPKTKIDVVYGDGKGKLEAVAQIARAIRLLEPVAEVTADLTAWASSLYIGNAELRLHQRRVGPVDPQAYVVLRISRRFRRTLSHAPISCDGAPGSAQLAMKSSTAAGITRPPAFSSRS